jgi:3-oxoacyl-[acyl-carrier-protein] synthase II
MDSTDLHVAPDEAPRRVVVTGVGVVSPIGRSIDEFWRSLTSGRSGLTALPAAGSAESLPTCGGAVADFRGHIDDFGPLPDDLRKQIRKSLKLMNRETQLAVAAAQQALRDSGLQSQQIDSARSGVSFGAGYVGIRPDDFLSGVQACRDASGIPEFADWGEKGVPEVHPLWLLTCLPNMPSCYIAMYNSLQGPNNTITLGDAAINLAVAEGWHAIRERDADVMVVGGCGHNLDSCSRLHAWHDDDLPFGRSDAATVLRPFDRDRTGTLPAEGAGVLVLEELRAAQQRGATLYGEIVGAGSSCVVQGRMPRHGAALVNAMRSALGSAGCRPESIGHVQAHGHGSRRVDAAEARAIRAVFGERTSTLPVTAAKSYFGDAGAGSGALELIAGLLALQHGRVFPVLNCEHPDPDCPIKPVLMRDEPPAAGDCFLKTSVTPQGQASAVVVRRAA